MPDWSNLATGSSHTCALLGTGAVHCWGDGDYGKLGNGNTNDIGDNETPNSVVTVVGAAVQIAAGTAHTCALLDSGATRCWGFGSYGQLGYGNTNTIGDNEALAIDDSIDVGGTVAQIAAGRSHTCALLNTGAVHCWGQGIYGQLGYGNMNNIGDNEAPAIAGNVKIEGTVVQIAAGRSHTCALLDTKAVRCWGNGFHGQLGYGNMYNIGDNEAPGTAGDVNVGGTVIQITAGFHHTCALLSTGMARCWGDGSYGQLGYGNTNNIGDDELPVTAGDVDISGTVVQIAAGGSHTCALLDTGAVQCWGQGIYGRLGYGNIETIGDDELPVTAGNVDADGTVVQIATGGSHTCVLLDTGAVRCWGDGFSGQLGYGNTINIGDNEVPAVAGDVNVGTVAPVAANSVRPSHLARY